MSKLVNICLIGTGRAGMIHGKNFARRIENAKLIALCDPSKKAWSWLKRSRLPISLRGLSGSDGNPRD